MKRHNLKRKSTSKRKTKARKGSGNKLTRAAPLSEEEMDEILEEESVSITPRSSQNPSPAPTDSGRSTPRPAKNIFAETKDDYIDFLVSNINKVIGAHEVLSKAFGDKIEKNEKDKKDKTMAVQIYTGEYNEDKSDDEEETKYKPSKKYLNRNFEDLSETDQTKFTQRYSKEAELLRKYMNTLDKIYGLDEQDRLPLAIKITALQIIQLYSLFPFVIELGTQSPEEGEDIKKALERLRLSRGMEFSVVTNSPEERKEKVMKAFTKDLEEKAKEKREIRSQLDGGKKRRKSSSKKRKSKSKIKKRSRKTKKNQKRKSTKKK